MAEIGVIGAGSWGTALSAHLGRCGHDVKVWSIDPAEVDMLNQEHEQKVKLPGVILPENVSASGDLSEVMQGRGILVLVVPSPFVRSTAARMAPFYEEGQLIVSAAKGIEENTLLTLSEIIQQEISGARGSVLCGPTHCRPRLSRALRHRKKPGWCRIPS